MSSRDCFAVVLRSFGLVALAACLLYLYSAFAVLASINRSGSSPAEYFVAAIISLLIGMYSLKGAPHVVAFAYGPSSVAPPSQLTLCSFCGKAHTEVKKLIQGPGVYICDGCVGVCKNVLEKEFSKDKSQAEKTEVTPQ